VRNKVAISRLTILVLVAGVGIIGAVVFAIVQMNAQDSLFASQKVCVEHMITVYGNTSEEAQLICQKVKAQ
jgi:uncharacterized membrane protein